MNLELLLAKDAIFRLISQFQRPTKFYDGELYIHDYCESALEHAFNVLGIKEDRIKLYDFCKMWEDNNRTIWAINFPNKPFDGVTADDYYSIFKEDYECWRRTMFDEDGI